jgi:hypothetical protein
MHNECNEWKEAVWPNLRFDDDDGDGDDDNNNNNNNLLS